jgi:PAT family beta-lactamase induction signal transducer AmpG
MPRSPWWWIPTLYYGQGLPYVVVMTLAVVLYKNLGLDNTAIALYTSWLYLPWVIKPLWSPLVDLLRTKRWWIVTLQLVVGAALATVALTLPMSGFFQLSLAMFWLLAFASATHDIAADGFYLLALPQRQQAAFVGVRSLFYRVAMISGQGGLVFLAGHLADRLGSVVLAWQLVFFTLAGAVRAAGSVAPCLAATARRRPRRCRRAGAVGRLYRDLCVLLPPARHRAGAGLSAAVPAG